MTRPDLVHLLFWLFVVLQVAAGLWGVWMAWDRLWLVLFRSIRHRAVRRRLFHETRALQVEERRRRHLRAVAGGQS